MAGNQEFMQMMGMLLNMAQQRRQHDLEERKFGEHQTQFKEMVRQFEHTHQDKDFSEAMLMMSKLVPEQQVAFSKILQSRFAQQNPEIVDALMQFGGASPVAQGAGAMSPQQRGMANNEAAFGAIAGAPAGAVGASQLQGQLAQGAMQMTAEQFGQLANNFGARTAQGYTPEQFALQAAATNISGSNSKLGWAQLDLAERELLARYDLKGVEAAMKAGQQLTPQQIGETARAQANILNDINSARSDRAGNIMRIQVYNRLADLTGTPKIPVPGQTQPPQPFGPPAGPAMRTPGQPLSTPEPASAMNMYWRQFFPNQIPQP